MQSSSKQRLRSLLDRLLNRPNALANNTSRRYLVMGCEVNCWRELRVLVETAGYLTEWQDDVDRLDKRMADYELIFPL